MNYRGITNIALACILASAASVASATDEALLQVLLNNKLITQEQYEALVKAQTAQAATVPAQAGSEKRLPTQEEGLLEVLLTNGLLSQEQYAALQVKNAEDKAKKQEVKEAKVTLADGFKVKSTDGDFQVQAGMYAMVDSAWYGDSDTDFSNGTELRRGRLSLAGTVYRDWDFKL